MEKEPEHEGDWEVHDLYLPGDIEHVWPMFRCRYLPRDNALSQPTRARIPDNIEKAIRSSQMLRSGPDNRVLRSDSNSIKMDAFAWAEFFDRAVLDVQQQLDYPAAFGSHRE